MSEPQPFVPQVVARPEIYNQHITFGGYDGDVKGVCDDIRRQADGVIRSSQKVPSSKRYVYKERAAKLMSVIDRIKLCTTVDEVTNILTITSTTIRSNDIQGGKSRKGKSRKGRSRKGKSRKGKSRKNKTRRR
jgi:hypothetical protein